MKLQFIGAAGTVTGSKCVIQNEDKCYLIDAGLFQGEGKLVEKNLTKFNPDILKKLEGVFITHAHLDHCGYLPYLVNQGFSGPIFMTEATKDLVQLVLEDAFSILSHSFEEHKMESMPYSEDDVALVISKIVVKEKGVESKHDSLRFKFIEAGHILGASSLWLEWNQKSVLFSGDLGRADDLIHVAPDICTEKVDVVIIEGTYGGRTHSKESPMLVLSEAVDFVRSREGVLFIPSFAIARSVVVLKILKDFFTENSSRKLKVFVDSPMMIKAIKFYLNHASELKISKEELNEILDNVKMVEFPKDRKKLIKLHPPYILVSSSGMLTGGRSAEHFERIAIKDFNQVLFVGYQGIGTLGRKVIEGEQSFIADGKDRQIKAKISALTQLSAHADDKEMIQYLKKLNMSSGKVFINHAESKSANLFHQSILSELKLDAIIAEENKTYEL